MGAYSLAHSRANKIEKAFLSVLRQWMILILDMVRTIVYGA